MEIYSAKVRLGGSVLNEVPKTDLTAPEVIILQTIHGRDAVVNLEVTGKSSVPHDDERERLEMAYGYNPETKRTWVAELFGPSHQELPIKIKGGSDPAAKIRRRQIADDKGLPGIPGAPAAGAEAVL